jgi:hypothetical protein
LNLLTSKILSFGLEPPKSSSTPIFRILLKKRTQPVYKVHKATLKRFSLANSKIMLDFNFDILVLKRCLLDEIQERLMTLSYSSLFQHQTSIINVFRPPKKGELTHPVKEESYKNPSQFKKGF